MIDERLIVKKINGDMNELKKVISNQGYVTQDLKEELIDILIGTVKNISMLETIEE